MIVQAIQFGLRAQQLPGHADATATETDETALAVLSTVQPWLPSRRCLSWQPLGDFRKQKYLARVWQQLQLFSDGRPSPLSIWEVMLPTQTARSLSWIALAKLQPAMLSSAHKEGVSILASQAQSMM